MVGMGGGGVAAEVAACLQASEVYQISAEELDFANDPVHGTGSTAERGQGRGICMLSVSVGAYQDQHK